jgi:methylmalonyl-CoA mutase N-terminal domain/subunit
MEREARELLEEIEAGGGAARAIERGVFQQAIARSAYDQQRAVESGATVVVGVNEYTDEQPIASVPAPDYSALAALQRQRLAAARARRAPEPVTRTLAALRAAAARPGDPLLPEIVEAVRARATVGEIADALRAVWGVYQPR